MELITENGYYLSDPFHYVDWHAGHKFEKLNYTAFWFLKGNKVLLHGKSNDKDFNKEEFKTIGYYEVKDDVVNITFQKGEKFEAKQEMILIQKGQMMNKNERMFDFVKWNK
ncbi:hypothetical protein CLV33_1244 [Jejuia pallidilutea]|uniref:Lipocalin-like domain-containing protein n=1 Tax=Jejuia pallidilutea TaxID=504487 RepID=A0A362WWW6_9FLAO|nr:hypothetical protein [Jejuia pallidilutea]PQV44404.1 hypothetical protein CLV33_1244 [Jejuia pallidilutea]